MQYVCYRFVHIFCLFFQSLMIDEERAKNIHFSIKVNTNAFQLIARLIKTKKNEVKVFLQQCEK